MKGIQLVPYGTKIQFTKGSKIVYGITIAITIASLLGLGIRGLNYGIDFLGGFLVEIRTSEPADLGALRQKMTDLNLGDVKLQSTDSPNDVMIRVEQQKGGEEAQSQAVQKIRDTLGESVEYRRVDIVGPTVSEDLKRNGMIALSLALLAMLVYIWFRFEWQFGLCAVISLVHDAIAVMGLYALFQLDFNETVLIALLTTIGYSINDTVVVYDRIRENLRKYKKATTAHIIDLSINETLSRTVLTSGSTLLALGCLYTLGGPVIAAFSFPLIFGILVGTYSSICVSSLLLQGFDLRSVVETSSES